MDFSRHCSSATARVDDERVDDRSEEQNLSTASKMSLELKIRHEEEVVALGWSTSPNVVGQRPTPEMMMKKRRQVERTAPCSWSRSGRTRTATILELIALCIAEQTILE